MKLFRQVVLPFAIVLALIAGVTFVSHFSDPPNRATPKTQPAPPLSFLSVRPSWDDDDPKYAKEFELDQPGYYDFWFRNPHPSPVQVTLKSGAELLLGMVPDQDWGRTELGKAALPSVWHSVPRGQAVEVPAAGEGVLRLSWRGAKTEDVPVRQTALLALRLAGGAGKSQQLEIPVRFVKPVQAIPAPRSADELELTVDGPASSTDFYCWSATREAFDLQVDPKLPACFRVDWQPLEAKEREWLNDQKATRVRSGYRVRVTVSERAANQVLDLGRFEQLISLSAAGTRMTLKVSGIVRGPARILTPGVDEKINLKGYPRSQGTTAPYVLGVDSPVQDLRVVSSPAGVQVELEKTVEGRWQLTVKVPANGPIELNSAIILELVGLERRWRIPLTAQGTQ